MYNLLVICLIASALSYATAVRCYSCQSCPIPWDPASARIQDNCLSCARIEVYTGDKPLQVSRQCLPVCEETDKTVLNQRFVTKCCKSDLCNVAVQTAVTPLVLLFSGICAVITNFNL
ncbi:hypothetical protein P879_06581 [Paragonimus westermani]|uniref:Snake toxin/toxin-like domain-containing protein n=1 Tax=Paragonimus westermani TaxID=34504 RepID=A0A8T0DJ93_9TREM|nr:hypothetical protein P879_06581 [Paragonimus westermani]